MTNLLRKDLEVSIIIAVKKYNKNLESCISKCLNLSYSNFGIFIFPDEAFSYNHPKVKVVPTGNITPGKKRNLALKFSQSEIFAFLDDDAYPEKDWLSNAVKNFNEDVAAVGGPSVTPIDDGIREKASGLIYESILVSGPANFRYIPKYKRFVEDFPSCNFLVKRDIFEQIGGFDEKYWPGEDTVLCLNITKVFKKKIVYDPKALIYHHRRPIFRSHLRQLANYGLHRGFFVKKYPQTSLRPAYFIPSLFIIYLIFGLFLYFFSAKFKVFYIFSLLSYLIVIAIAALKGYLSNKPHHFKLIPYVFFGIIISHVSYGFNFLRGLFRSRLHI